MIKIFVIQKTLTPWDKEVQLHLEKDGVVFELNAEEFKELSDVLDGKRQMLQTAPKDGEYYSEYIYLHNYDKAARTSDQTLLGEPSTREEAGT